MIHAISKCVLATIDVDIIDTACVVFQKALYIDNWHAVYQYHCWPRTIVGIIRFTHKQLWHAIYLLVSYAVYIFKQHFPDGQELTIFVKIVGQIRFDAKYCFVVVQHSAQKTFVE